MGTLIYIPKMGANISTALVVKLFARKGDTVKKGDILFEVETEKAVYGIEAESEGMVLALEAELGKRYNVLDELGFIGTAGETIAPFKRTQQTAKTDATTDIKATPSAKKLAADNGIDILSAFKGISKIIKESDILEYIASLTQTNAIAQDISPRKLAEIEAISHNKEYIVSSVTMTCSASKLKEAILKAKSELRINLSSGEFLSFRIALSLKKFPLLNSYFHAGKFMVYKMVNLGIAINVGNELLVPVIKNASGIPLSQFAEEYKQHIMKTVKNALIVEDMDGGTFTVSDLSATGVLSFQPLINARQSAIVGIGSEYDSCAQHGGKLSHDSKINLTIAFDHRITDGKYAAEFLADVISF